MSIRPFTRDRDENNSDRFQVIPPVGQAYGMNVNTNTFQTGLGCNLDIETTHANKSHLKLPSKAKGNKLTIL
jgi:hypothetical protein